MSMTESEKIRQPGLARDGEYAAHEGHRSHDKNNDCQRRIDEIPDHVIRYKQIE